MKLLEKEPTSSVRRWRDILNEILDIEKRVLVEISANYKTPIETVRWHGGRVAVLHEFVEQMNNVLKSRAVEEK